MRLWRNSSQSEQGDTVPQLAIFAVGMRLLFVLLVLAVSKPTLGRTLVGDADPVKYQYHRDSNAHRILTYGADLGLRCHFQVPHPIGRAVDLTTLPPTDS